MPAPRLRLDQCLPYVQAYQKASENGPVVMTELAKQFNMNETTLRRRIETARARWGITPESIRNENTPTDEEIDELGDGRELLNRHAELNAEAIEAEKRKRWRIIPVKPEPFAIAFVGDPHVDNKGSDLSALSRDLEIIRDSGMRAVNMGDLLDNFHMRGKLASKQAGNRMSAKDGMAIARWVIRDSGVRWDAHLLGNHDAWAGDQGAALFFEWARAAGSRFYNWAVQITYQWDGGSYTVMAAHDFKGGSIYNALHGPMRRALEDGTADLYVAAHRHEAAMAEKENGFRQRHYKFLRVKGYKRADEYAWEKGYAEQNDGASGGVVIDPSADGANRARTFLDLELAAEWLTMLRAR